MNDTFRLERLFSTVPVRVWRAWTNADELRHWWAPTGFHLAHCEIEAKDGGLFHFGLAPVGSAEVALWGRWRFERVDMPRRMDFIGAFSDPAGAIDRNPMNENWPLEIESFLEFTEEPEGTRVVMECTPINATALERGVFAQALPMMQMGWNATFAKLATFLEDNP
jgi:uncharacterized protein YndB with AHSA1/START domain